MKSSNPSSKTGVTSRMKDDPSRSRGEDHAPSDSVKNAWFDDGTPRVARNKSTQARGGKFTPSSRRVEGTGKEGSNLGVTLQPTTPTIPGGDRPDEPASPDTKAAIVVAATVEAVLLRSPPTSSRRSVLRRAFSGAFLGSSRRLGSGRRMSERSSEDAKAAAAAVEAALAVDTSFPQSSGSSDGQLPRSRSGGATPGGHEVEGEIRASFRAWRASPQSTMSTIDGEDSSGEGAGDVSSSSDSSSTSESSSTSDSNSVEESEDQDNAGRSDVDRSEDTAVADAVSPEVATEEPETAEFPESPRVLREPSVPADADYKASGAEEESRESETLPPSPVVSGSPSTSTGSFQDKDDQQLQCRRAIEYPRHSDHDEPCEEEPRLGIGMGLAGGEGRGPIGRGFLGSYASLRHASFRVRDARSRAEIERAELLLDVFGTEDPPIGFADVSGIVGPASRITALPPLERARLDQIDGVLSSDVCDESVFSDPSKALVRVGAEKRSSLADGDRDGTAPYRYRRLVGVGGSWPPEVDPDHREQWLAPAEFEAVFEMSFEAFEKLPWWKQLSLKQEVCLF